MDDRNIIYVDEKEELIHYAKCAMIGLLASGVTSHDQIIARQSFAIADAMMAEETKRVQGRSK